MSLANNPKPALRRSKVSLILGFCAVLALMAFLVIIRSYELDVSKKRMEFVANNHLTKMNLAMQMRTAARERTVGLQRMLLLSDPFVRDEEWIRFNRNGAEFARSRLQILAMGLSDDEKVLLDHQGELTKKALDLQKRVIDLIDKDKLLEARDVLEKGAAPAQDQVLNQLTTFYHFHEQAAKRAALDAANSHNETQNLIYVCAFIAGLLSIAIAAFVIYRTNKAERQFSNAFDELLNQNDEKSQFLANMIDEYKSPLNSLIEYSDSIVNNVNTNEHNENKSILSELVKIQNACHHLHGITSEILDMTKVESGKSALTSVDFSIHHLVNDVVNQIKPIAAKNNNQIEFLCPENIGFMESDPIKLRQILFNLLANACKFTEFGVITLSVKRDFVGDEYNADATRWITFNVIDTGIGISFDRMDTIFELAQDVANPAIMRKDDSGLSLAISRRICNLLGGKILVNSEPGMGSVFTIRLPVTLPQSRMPAFA